MAQEAERQLLEASKGFHAILDDDLDLAKEILSKEESAFHAIGLGLITFLEAALGQENADLAQSVAVLGTAERLASVQHRQAVREKRAIEAYPPGLEFEIVKADATFAQAITSFLGESYLQYLSAVYKLRSSYKMFESTFKIAYPNGVPSDMANGGGGGDGGTRSGAGQTRKSASLSRPLTTTTPSPGTTRRLSWMSLGSLGRTISSTDAAQAPGSPLPATREEGSPTAAAVAAASTTRGRERKDVAFKQFILSGAAFGYGCFSLIFSLLPPKIKRFIGVFGLKGDRMSALADLQASAWASDDVHASFAALTLITYWTAVMTYISYVTDFKGTIRKCEALLDRMQGRYPNGRLWLLNRAKILKMKGDNLGAIDLLEKGVQGIGGFKQMKGLLYFELGWDYLIELDYLKTEDTFSNKMTELNSWSPVTYAWIGLGCFLAHHNQTPETRQSAEKLYQALPAMMNRKKMGAQSQPPTEMYVRRTMKFYETKHRRWIKEGRIQASEPVTSVIKVPIIHSMMLFWNLHTHMSHANLDRLIQDLSGLRDATQDPTSGFDIDTPDERAVQALLIGVCYRAKAQYAEAKTWLDRCIEREKEVLDDRWAIPFAIYERAVIEMWENANKKAAERWLQDVTQRTGYDLEQRLVTRVQMLRDELAMK